LDGTKRPSVKRVEEHPAVACSIIFTSSLSHPGPPTSDPAVQAKAMADRFPSRGEDNPSARSPAALPRGSLSLEHSSMLTTGSMWMRVSRIWT
jgi:hypothetical protein